MAEVGKASDADFKEKVLGAEGAVLVDFFGKWCAPCLKLKPALADIAAENEGKLSVVEVEVSEATETAGELGVMGVPTIMLFVGGEPKETLTGSPTKADIMKAVGPYLGA
jgi:thioredoxin 1